MSRRVPPLVIETNGLIQVLAAVAVAVGGVTAVAARTPRVAILGLLVALLGAPSITSAVPDPLAAAPRLIGGVLAGDLLWIAVRAAPAGALRGTRIGWAGEVAIGTAAFAAGASIALAMLPDPTTVVVDAPVVDRAALVGGLAAATVLAVVAAGPVLLARDVLRSGLGLLLLLTAVALTVDAVAGLPAAPRDVFASRVVSLAVAVATAAIAAAVAWLAHVALAERGDLELAAGPRAVLRPAPQQLATRRAGRDA